MRVLVTGGAGFIGSSLVDLLAGSSDIVIIDNFSTGKLSNLPRKSNAIQIIEGNIEDIDLFALGKIDGVIHLAAQASVSLSIEDFRISTRSNINGSVNVMDYCCRSHVPLVYASSSAVYGNLSLGDDAIGDVDLLSPYAADKYAMEIYAQMAHKVYGLSSIGLRFFNVYGPRQDPHSPYSGVISVFIERMLKKEPIVINGGSQTRDFIFVKDVIDCIYRSFRIASRQNICGQINILTGKSITIETLSDLIANEIGFAPQKIYADLPLGDPIKSSGTIKLMQRLLETDPKCFSSLETGLAKTIQYYKESI